MNTIILDQTVVIVAVYNYLSLGQLESRERSSCSLRFVLDYPPSLRDYRALAREVKSSIEMTCIVRGGRQTNYHHPLSIIVSVKALARYSNPCFVWNTSTLWVIHNCMCFSIIVCLPEQVTHVIDARAL